MAGTLSIIRSEELEDQENEEIQPLRFVEVVDRLKPEFANQFIRLRRDGRLPLPEEPQKKTEVPAEEIHRRRLEKLERETYQRAFAAGEKAGLEMGEQRMRVMLEEAQAFLEQLQNIPVQVMTEAIIHSEKLLVETAILLVRELLGHELTVQPAGIAARVQRVLEQAGGRSQLVLYLSPKDAKVLAGMPDFSHLKMVHDPTLARGSVRLETDFGGVENLLDLQLKEMETVLREYLRGRVADITGQTEGETGSGPEMPR